MKIYTKKGDAGETGLFGGGRVPKDHLRIQTYGTLDELNASLGLVLTDAALSPQVKSWLLMIQGELFQLGAELATPPTQKVATALVTEKHVERLESEIDQMEASLPPLKTFILPGGTPAASKLHVARTISRRAERELVGLHRSEPVRPVVSQYMNRISDYLFVCARYANFQQGVPDTPWIAPSA